MSERLDNPRVSHESSDVRIRPLLWTAGTLFLTIALTLVAMFLLEGWFIRLEQSGDPPPSVFAGARTPPPEPRLQVYPEADYKKMRAEHEQRIRTYAWKDRAHQRISIPIERAMELVAEKGPPKWPDAGSEQHTHAHAHGNTKAHSHDNGHKARETHAHEQKQEHTH
ncbi:MAG TPA: hypothetical protein VEK08_25740 [Planctomycetota bacterium]|nr:hypothetical protein [Planctomycetota bacterium]